MQYGIPPGTNLYGNHPIYFEHRPSGTHAVFLLNSNGMDIKINSTISDDGSANATSLEYNVIGGVLDFYFLAGSETDPAEAARQYAEVVGLPAEVPYWSFGLHQCRYHYVGMCIRPSSLLVVCVLTPQIRFCGGGRSYLELLTSRYPLGNHVDRQCVFFPQMLFSR